MKMHEPTLYLSPSCRHCRALMGLVERTGGKGKNVEVRRFVNIGGGVTLPDYVDRVPLLADGRGNVVTDEALFRLFETPRKNGNRNAVAAAREPDGVVPSSGLDFSSSFSNLGGDMMDDDSMLTGNMWLVDGEYDAIETPESEPMPKKSP